MELTISPDVAEAYDKIDGLLRGFHKVTIGHLTDFDYAIDTFVVLFRTGVNVDPADSRSYFIGKGLPEDSAREIATVAGTIQRLIERGLLR